MSSLTFCCICFAHFLFVSSVVFASEGRQVIEGGDIVPKFSELLSKLI